MNPASSKFNPKKLELPPQSNAPLRVFVGFDPRQPVAFQVAAHSILTRCSKPVSITALRLPTLPVKRRGLTDFTYARFCTPWLSDYEGFSIFVDSDILCLGDVSDLIGWAYADGAAAEAKDTPVYVSQNQLRFEWASVMVFNNEACKVLTPEFVDDPANSLFDFAWAERVGKLPPAWNHLVGYDEPRKDAKLVHFTQGLPCFEETKDSEYADEWRTEARKSMTTCSFDALMGKSVHAPHVRARMAAVGR
jgi:lipopolysaccharide biosynthesis glycosyltransferase